MRVLALADTFATEYREETEVRPERCGSTRQMLPRRPGLVQLCSRWRQRGLKPATIVYLVTAAVVIWIQSGLSPETLHARVHRPLSGSHHIRTSPHGPYFAGQLRQQGHRMQLHDPPQRPRTCRVVRMVLPGEALVRSWISSHLAKSMANSASVGAVGAIVAALLSAITEPALNRVLVKRMTIQQAIREVELRHILAYFRTVLATNLLKFPFFEAVNTATSALVGVPMLLRGVLSGVIYTTAMLPLANYRYAKSLQMKADWGLLYQAYWPTLLRDIIYGIMRTEVTASLLASHPALAATVGGRSIITFFAVAAACVGSAPGNELRAFCLQRNDGGGLPPKEFFKMERFVRSTMFSAVVCATALALGQLLVGQAWVLSIWLHPIMPPLVITLFCIQEFRFLSLIVAFFGFLNLAKARQEYDELKLPRTLEVMKRKCEASGADLLPDEDGDIEEGGSDSEQSLDDNDASSLASTAASPTSSEVSLPTTAAVAAFVMPAFCNVVANSMMSAVDKMFIGRHSSLELAALGPAASAFDGASFLLTFLNTATMTLLGSVPMRSEEADKVRSYAVILAAGAAVLMATSLFAVATPACQFNGASRVMLPFSVVYLRLRLLGAPIERCASVTTAFCFAAKDVNTPLFVTIVGLSANFVLDGLLVSRYGSAGVAIASVTASGIAYLYLVRRLRRRGLWPSPLRFPESFKDIEPFLGFAGPVLLAVFAKIMTFNRLTAAASSLGTASAAAHQIFMTLLYLCPVALGNPFSWAAQAFLPPLLAADAKPGRARTTRWRSMFARALYKLAVSAVVTSVIGSGIAVAICVFGNRIFVRDPLAVAELVRASMSIVPFFTLYPVLLTLEGALYSAQRREAALTLSALFWLVSCAIMSALSQMGRLTLSTLWLGCGFSCGLSVLLTLVVVMRPPKSQRIPGLALSSRGH